MKVVKIDSEVILKRAGVHCKLGPKVCKDCKEAGKETYFLLYKIEECKTPYMQHPHYSRSIGDQLINLCDSSVIKKFKTEKEAKDYAKKNNVNFV
ncbi:hypothetical protein J4450_04155 [Candidatus Micrarchaeota archaeon]|nr:hypothetical protein [Candidatus Micrarchaeota archaeon]